MMPSGADISFYTKIAEDPVYIHLFTSSYFVNDTDNVK